MGLIKGRNERRANREAGDRWDEIDRLTEAGLIDVESESDVYDRAYQAAIDGGATTKEATDAAQAERRGYAAEQLALYRGLTPEAAARVREREASDDFRSRIARRRDKKQERAAGHRAEAEETMQQNVDLATELTQRDYGTSAMSDIAPDPVAQAAQMDALSRFGDISREGFTDLDRQALDQSFMQSRREEQAQRDAALLAAQRRGDASGGNALLGSLMAQQGGANRAAQYGTDIAIEGRNRAMQALGAYGNAASNIRSQSFGEQATRGGAVDQFNQWAAGQRSSDVGQLMGANAAQTQYNLLRAGELKPKSAGQIVGGVVQLGQDVGQLVGGMIPQGGTAPAAAPASNPFDVQQTAATGRTAATPGTSPLAQFKQRRTTGGGGFGGSYG
jgi:hypothetical protein